MGDVQVEQIYLEDGRKAERRVIDDGDERVLELYVEPPKPEPEKLLNKRVIEKKRPVVYERVIETVENGEVVDRKVEAIAPKVEMNLLEHHVSAQQAVVKSVPKKEMEDQKANCVTHEELQQAILTAVKAVRKHDVSEEERVAPVTKTPKFSMQEVVGERVEQSKTASIINIGLAALIAAQVGVLGYLLFFM